MQTVQFESFHQSSPGRASLQKQPSGKRNFASTLADMQNALNRDEQLSAAQARMVIRMVGAAITGDFQQLSGWSGEEAQDFFSRFNLLRSFSPEQGPSPYSAGRRSSAQQVTRAYQEMASTPAPGSDPAPQPAARTSDSALTASTKGASPPTDIHQLIDRVAQQMDLPSRLVHAVVFAESSYRPDAISPAGAQGLMQLMPATAQEVGVKNAFDPQDNLIGGCEYLKRLLEKYNGDLDHTLAAYNWGQGNVDRKGLEQMPLETRDYIIKVKEGLENQV
jgi:soluble lytic murein transglycosylase-like protein